MSAPAVAESTGSGNIQAEHGPGEADSWPWVPAPLLSSPVLGDCTHVSGTGFLLCEVGDAKYQPLCQGQMGCCWLTEHSAPGLGHRVQWVRGGGRVCCVSGGGPLGNSSLYPDTRPPKKNPVVVADDAPETS